MAVDKLVDSTQLNADLTSVANAIRTKGGTSAQLAFPSGFVSAIGDIPTGSGGESAVKYTRYTLTGDTTIKQFIDSINYRVQDAMGLAIMIRVSGTVAPSTGGYTINNYVFYFLNNGLGHGRHSYKIGCQTPDSFDDLPSTNENDNNVSISNNILTSNYSGSSCIGTTGDVVTIAEIPISVDNTIMNGGAI